MSHKIINIIFSILCIAICLFCGIKALFINYDVNKYENRKAYKTKELKNKNFFDKSFQDHTELVLSDQIPNAILMKKVDNFSKNLITNIVTNKIFNNHCKNRYIKLSETTITFDCEKNLVYTPLSIENYKKEFDDRIQNINQLISNTDLDVYVYYIEKDTDIDFTNNEKTNVYEYLQNGINTNHISRYRVDNFNDFKSNFYKTDHHWNYKGSYKAYTELVDFLTDDEPISFTDEFCVKKKFGGTKAAFSGCEYFYNETFCAYKFDLPDMRVTINGEEGQYGHETDYYLNRDIKPTYSDFYGIDFGEVVFENSDSKGQNILVLGESYDDAIIKLLATHFNKLYAVDLRYYEVQNSKKFDINEYIKNNNIDKILLIGNYDFYHISEFDVEVK